MADLFLSYEHQDIKRAETLAQLLEDNELTVWWDRRMVAGDKIRHVIEEEIKKSKAVIVLWSPRSVASNWVLGEAQTAHELAKLIPIKIQECKLPIDYRAIHTPEVYKNKAELDKLAKMLSDKFRTAPPLQIQDRTAITTRSGGKPAAAKKARPRRATARPSAATKIEFTDRSSTKFLIGLAAESVALKNEFDVSSGVERLRLIKKYPRAAFLVLVLCIAAVGLVYTVFGTNGVAALLPLIGLFLLIWFISSDWF